MLNDRTFGGVLSETRMEALFETLIGSNIEEIHDEMKKLQYNQQIDGDGGKTKIGCKERYDSELFLHPHDWVFHQIPVDWQFPQCTLSVVYCLWHFEDQVKKIGPLKFLDSGDINFPTITGTCADGVCIIWQRFWQGVHFLDEIRTIMSQFDDGVKVRGLLLAPLYRQKVLVTMEKWKDCLEFPCSQVSEEGNA